MSFRDLFYLVLGNLARMKARVAMTAIGVVIGAGWNGARSFTATSGPGFSLMQEALGYAIMA